MHYAIIFRRLGILLMLFSITQLVPLAVSLFYQDGIHLSFVLSFLVTFIVGLVTWAPVYNAKEDLRTRDGFLVTSLFWIVLSVFGSLPFLLGDHLTLSFSDAIFESTSGLTTTGATVITGLDNLPKSILYYRQQLQWLGGIGIIVIAVAILPMLGIGGMQLYRTETPGPVKDSKLTPRITETAKWLFFIYVTLTIACALCYWIAGMTPFDAIAHSFSTIAIGGFSTHDASMGYFDNPVIWLIACFFMFIAGLNFALHYYLWHHGTVKQYMADSESRFYFFNLLILTVIITLSLQAYGMHNNLDHFYVQAIFQVISIATTTGFATTDFSLWPSFLPILLVFLSCVGGCAGSTGGGLKVIRIILVAKQGLRELKQLVHPNAVIPIKLRRQTVPRTILTAVWSFLAVYMLTFILVVLALQATGLDFISAYSATIAMINNLGPGLGSVAAHYGDTGDASKWVMCLAMLLGRLEIFTLLVLFTPAFWRS